MSMDPEAPEVQLAGLWSVSGVGMAQTDALTRRFLRVNAALCRLTGYGEAELLALALDGLDDPQDPAAAREAGGWPPAHGADEAQAERRWRRKDGGTVWVRVTCRLLRDAAGRPLRAFAVIEDVSARRLAEQRLRESQARLAMIFERALVGLSELAPDGRFLQANPELGRIVGRSPEALQRGLTIADVTHPQDVPPSLAAAGRVLAEGGSATLEKRYQRPDGSCVVAQSSLTRLEPHDGVDGPRLLAVTMDLTARRLAEAALRESEARYRLLFESMDEGFLLAQVLFDREGRVLDLYYLEANPAAIRMAGADFTGRRLLEMHAGFEPYWLEIFGRVARSGRGERQQRYAAPLGIWFDFYVFRVGGEGSARVAAIFQDITARHRAEEALREREDRVRAIANLVPDLLWSNGPDGRVDWTNRRWSEYTGQRHEQALGEGWTAAVQAEDLPVVLGQWREAIRLQQPLVQEYRLRRHDGEYRWHLGRAEPLRDKAGRVMRWFGSATDIHEERSARQQLERRVQERTRELRALLARMEHVQDEERRRIARELHDSLGQYLSSLALAVSGLSGQLRDPIARDRLATLQSLLLKVDHELDRIVFSLRPTALEDCGLGEGVAAYVATWAELTGTPVDLEVHGLDGQRLPAPVESAVFRVVQEALNNVSKHAQASRVSVSLERLRRQLVVSVEDDGVGFEPADGPAPGGEAPHWGLLGMKERVEALGGHFAVESQPGGGTAVLLRVPLDEGWAGR